MVYLYILVGCKKNFLQTFQILILSHSERSRIHTKKKILNLVRLLKKTSGMFSALSQASGYLGIRTFWNSPGYADFKNVLFSILALIFAQIKKNIEPYDLFIYIILANIQGMIENKDTVEICIPWAISKRKWEFWLSFTKCRILSQSVGSVGRLTNTDLSLAVIHTAGRGLSYT